MHVELRRCVKFVVDVWHILVLLTTLNIDRDAETAAAAESRFIGLLTSLIWTQFYQCGTSVSMVYEIWRVCGSGESAWRTGVTWKSGNFQWRTEDFILRGIYLTQIMCSYPQVLNTSHLLSCPFEVQCIATGGINSYIPLGYAPGVFVKHNYWK